MTKLTDTQLVILTGAAQRDDLGVVAIDKRAATKDAIASLLKSKHLKTVPRTPDLALWAKDEAGQALSLIVTPKALKLLGIEAPTKVTDQVPATSDETAPPEPKPAKRAPAAASEEKATTKLGAVIALMREPEGATLDQLMAATGWQAHSVRGVISGAIRKKLGLTVISERTGEIRTYRIAA